VRSARPSAGRSAGRSAGGSAGRPAGHPAGRLVEHQAGRPAGRLLAVPVSSAVPKKKSLDRGGPVWPPGSNAADDRLRGWVCKAPPAKNRRVSGAARPSQKVGQVVGLEKPSYIERCGCKYTEE